MSSFLLGLIRSAEKVFVWVQFNDFIGAYIQVTKKALTEFIEQAEHPIELSPWTVLHEGELYLGNRLASPHMECDTCSGERWITSDTGELEQCRCSTDE